LNKDGIHGAASLWRSHDEKSKPASYAVHDGSAARLAECASFFDTAGGA